MISSSPGSSQCSGQDSTNAVRTSLSPSNASSRSNTSASSSPRLSTGSHGTPIEAAWRPARAVPHSWYIMESSPSTRTVTRHSTCHPLMVAHQAAYVESFPAEARTATRMLLRMVSPPRMPRCARLPTTKIHKTPSWLGVVDHAAQRTRIRPRCLHLLSRRQAVSGRIRP